LSWLSVGLGNGGCPLTPSEGEGPFGGGGGSDFQSLP